MNTWLGGGLPPMSSNFLSNFTTRYLDPTEVYGRFRELAAEFPDLATIIPLPYKTNGYQRRAQAMMAGLTNPAFTGNSPHGATGGAGRHPHVAGVGTRGRERPHGGVRRTRRRRTHRSP